MLFYALRDKLLMLKMEIKNEKDAKILPVLHIII